jgi:hypothetical protein
MDTKESFKKTRCYEYFEIYNHSIEECTNILTNRRSNLWVTQEKIKKIWYQNKTSNSIKRHVYTINKLK